MITYQDRTFCTAVECGSFTTCNRSLTQEVIDRATSWWGEVNPPIARFSDPEALPCYKPNTNTENENR